MSVSEIEIDAMHRAIALSAFGLGRTSPNPPVGCVILDSAGRVAGEGYHERKGEPHAEVHALTAAGERARGGTAVVTLEPCNHQGRTPPCRQALLDAGIVRTVIALIDPTSREEGGAARLRASGVQVEVGVLADAARLVLGPWLDALRSGRPHVTWAYRIGANRQVVAAGAGQVGALAAGVDVVVHEDGRVVEAVPGAHGEGVFRLPVIRQGAGPEELLAGLYRGGTRSVLLAVARDGASEFVHGGLVDDISVFLGSEGPAGVPMGGVGPVPQGFVVHRVSRVGSSVRLDARYQA
ncbi:bifunctional diaminohydroxyphosphoribosylaminopyrimidine deaminase/5-amino-6-(5-phosphoribosylamino)uracil reductase RibD [Actinosynnema sp. NPDC023587]|uniref:bifunctional diaminohydroxyphosphoribosylaminopyrimidine deaminase/5-amino-6-(5-phosphoribosylamino)uracil reductase RibD n=1 Tax=Actinosynnema sp. NPDC023587 TaxID=3154695 RepID=UPI0033E04D1C